MGKRLALFGELDQQAGNFEIRCKFRLFTAQACPFGGIVTQHMHSEQTQTREECLACKRRA